MAWVAVDKDSSEFIYSLDPNRLDPMGNIIDSPIAHCELTYLHELQHLLTLCKINFEFNV